MLSRKLFSEANVKLPVKLQDGSTVEVQDCEFDLLLHILYKHNFDKKKVGEEIEWLCEKNDDPNLRMLLLKQSLHQFSSELSNKILAKSIMEGIDHRKIAEDMLIDVNKIQYSLVEGAADMRKVLHLRKKVFVQEEGYPETRVTNGFEKDSLHVMATIRGELIGCVSIVFDSPKGLPMEQFLSVAEHKKDNKCIEVDKLAVVGEKRKRELAFHLMWICYSIARFWGAQKMFIFTLSQKADNLGIYERFGFKRIGAFSLFDNAQATALMLNFEDADTYEKQLKTKELLRLGKKLLNKFSLQKI